MDDPRTFTEQTLRGLLLMNVGFTGVRGAINAGKKISKKNMVNFLESNSKLLASIIYPLAEALDLEDDDLLRMTTEEVTRVGKKPKTDTVKH